MIKKVNQYIQQHHMVKKGDTIIVGVSGGADSVCLLSVLKDLQEELGICLICAHINHRFRDTALRDELYVKELCNKWQIPFYVKSVEVKKVAEEQKMSFEEAGRNVRYAFFEELKEKFQAAKIAVAHNKEDCAETVLFHLFRGSHLKGLGGISPVCGDVIRPLLDIERSEIEAYLRENNIEWQTDETNASTDYSRNYIRHDILPMAERMYPNVNRRIAETAAGLRETEDYLEIQAEAAMERCCEKEDGGTFIYEEKLAKEHITIISRLLYRVLEEESGTARDLGKIHVKELMKLFDLQSGKQISLPGDLCAYRSSKGIWVCKKGKMSHYEAETDDKSDGATTTVALLSKKELGALKEVQFELEGLGSIKAKVFSYDNSQIIPQKTYTKWFDYDKIIKCLVFRKRLEGDYLIINDAGNRKKLKEYLIQEKIPVYKRDEMWILTEDSHVVWVPGYRISAFYKVSENTKRVLEISIGGENNE